MRELLSLARQLRPTALDDLGLDAAIAGQVEQLDGAEAEAAFAREGDFADLDDDAQLVLYRVAQEALTNAARHSGAAQVDVTLRRAEDGVELEVADDGRGFAFEQSERGLGIGGMRERALLVGGELTIESRPARERRSASPFHSDHAYHPIEGLAQHRGHDVGFVVDLTFGKPDHLETAALEIQIPSSIVLEGLPAAVMEIVVRFDRQAPLSPEEVDEVRADANVDLRSWQAVPTTQRQELLLQIAARAVLRIAFVERQAQHVRLPDRPP